MFNLFRTKKRPAKRSQSLRQRLKLNPLESRCVMSNAAMIGSHLMIEGTKADDFIGVELDPIEYAAVVRTNGEIIGKFALDGMNMIEITGGDGNDRIYISNNIRKPSMIDGGAGNDQLFASEGHTRQTSLAVRDALARKPGRPSTSAILIGGEGNDMLFGTNDRDMLIGGDGRDVLLGNGAEDIVIAGRTFVDGEAKALFSLMATWNLTDAYVDRAAAVRFEMESMIPPDHDMSFVYHDGSADALYGGDGRDWFFAGNGVQIVDWTSDEAIDGELSIPAPVRAANVK